jgi:hypothetical protein
MYGAQDQWVRRNIAFGERLDPLMIAEEGEEEEKEGDRKVCSFGIQKINQTMNVMFGKTMQIWLIDCNRGTTQ